MMDRLQLFWCYCLQSKTEVKLRHVSEHVESEASHGIHMLNVRSPRSVHVRKKQTAYLIFGCDFSCYFFVDFCF